MSNALEQARAELDAKIAEFKREVAQNVDGKIGQFQTAVDDLTAAVQKVQEAQTDNNRDAFTAGLSDDDRQLRRYVEVDEKQYASNRGAFLVSKETKKPIVQLYGVRTHQGRHFRYGLLDNPAPTHEWQRELQRAVTDYCIIRECVAPNADGQRNTPIADEMFREAMQEAPAEFRRIFSSGVTNAGAEFQPQNLFPDLEREVQFMRGFSTIFDERSLPPSGKMDLPYIEGNLRPYKASAAGSDDPDNYTKSSIVTEKNSIAAVRQVIATQLDALAPEESIIAILPELREALARAHAFADDDIAINADTAGTHQDTIASWNTRGIWGASGLGTSADHRRSAIGLRARAFDISNTTDQNSVQTYAGVLTALKKLGPEYYARMHMGRLKLATSPEWFLNKLVQLSEFQTWDKVGPAAAVLTGFLGQRGMSPGSVGFINGFLECVITPFITSDLATTGKYTGSGATTGHLIFEASDFEWRAVPGISLRQAENIENDTITLVSRRRRVFRTKANDDQSTKKNVHWSFNLTP